MLILFGRIRFRIDIISIFTFGALASMRLGQQLSLPSSRFVLGVIMRTSYVQTLGVRQQYIDPGCSGPMTLLPLTCPYNVSTFVGKQVPGTRHTWPCQHLALLSVPWTSSSVLKQITDLPDPHYSHRKLPVTLQVQN